MFDTWFAVREPPLFPEVFRAYELLQLIRVWGEAGGGSVRFLPWKAFVNDPGYEYVENGWRITRKA